MDALRTQDRKRAAMLRFQAAYPHLGLSVAVLEKGPFELLKEWREGIGISSRMLEYYLAGSNAPTGKRLQKLERFLEEVRQVLVQKRVIEGSLDELVRQGAAAPEERHR